MSRAGPVSRAASVCRDDFQAGITWGEPARFMAEHEPWETGASLILYFQWPANAITWKNLSPVSRDPGTTIAGSRLTGLAVVM